MAKAYIGLGSNVGRREDHLEKALELLAAAKDVKVTKTSSIYETEPVGYVDQPDFLNAAVEIETALSPRELLAVTKAIEEREGRRRDIRWGPRTVDLDILLYDQQVSTEPDLRLPHPEVTRRAFVLVPLAEIAPDLAVADGQTVRDCLAELGKIKGVAKLDFRDWQKYKK